MNPGVAAPYGSGHRPPLGAHRLISQGSGGALVRPTGEIDWWTPQRFDATPALWSLLDPSGASAKWCDATIAIWDSCPAGPTAHTSIRAGSTRLQLWDGLVTVESSSVMVRLVTAPEACEVEHELRLGGFDAPAVEWARGVNGHIGSGSFVIIGDGAHVLEGDHSTIVRSTFAVTPNRWTGFAIIAGDGPPGASSPRTIPELVTLLTDAENTDRRSIAHVRLPLDHPSRAIDALRVLHALTDAATGAPIASPTTSLPEAAGGTRQFDYRYTWLRDSANAVATAALIGHIGASTEYVQFLHALVHRYGRELTPLTTTTGDRVPEEHEVVGVSGWAGSLPVRVGNNAGSQRQIDAVACVIEAIWVHVSCGGRMHRRSWKLVDHLATLIIDTPVGASNGVWEFRDAQPLVSEELARWAGLDRALKLKRLFRPWLRRRAWVAARRQARERAQSAVDPATGMVRQVFGEETLIPDASSLLMALNGFYRRRDPCLARLVRATISALEEGPFLRRYPPRPDGFDGVEGSFVPASWWAVSALATIGDISAAEQRANAMCSHLPPLQPEIWSVDGQHGLGNTPLLWSHTESARALYTLHNERVRRRVGTPGLWVWRCGRYVRLRLRHAR